MKADARDCVTHSRAETVKFFSVIVYGYAPLKAKSDCDFAIIRVVPRFKIVPDNSSGIFVFIVVKSYPYYITICLTLSGLLLYNGYI